MTKPFKRTIAVDQRDSVPDWEPFVQPVTRKWPAPLASEVPRTGRPFTVPTTEHLLPGAEQALRRGWQPYAFDPLSCRGVGATNHRDSPTPAVDQRDTGPHRPEWLRGGSVTMAAASIPGRWAARTRVVEALRRE